jgi:hypothetical protein
MKEKKVPLYETKYRNNSMYTVEANNNLDYWDGRGFSCGVEYGHRGLSRTRDGKYFIIETNDRYPSRDNAYLVSDVKAYMEICYSRNYGLFQKGIFKQLMGIPINELSKVINLEALKLFCDNDELDEIFIYGERVELDNFKTDPIRILILPSRNEIGSLEMIYKRLKFYLKKDIDIDLKVVKKIDKGYHGLDYSTGESFTLYWHDLPMYISITKYAIVTKSEYERVKPIDGTVDMYNRI